MGCDDTATLQFEGTSTRFDGQSLRLEVKAQGSATLLKSSSATVQAGGTWTSDAIDMSHQTNGTYTVMVTGTNSAGIAVSESQRAVRQKRLKCTDVELAI